MRPARLHPRPSERLTAHGLQTPGIAERVRYVGGGKRGRQMRDELASLVQLRPPARAKTEAFAEVSRAYV